MPTDTEIRKIMAEKGWNVTNVSYERPRSGFKCVEGGWLIEFETETKNDDYYELFKAIPSICSAICDNGGVIMGMLAKDVIALVKSLPKNPELIDNQQTQKQ